MRIIAGKHKGRRLLLPKEASEIIRPTSDFAREAIFNILMHGKHGLNGHSFIDKRVLDLFCGTGAFGLEALSRGAAHVTFIDNARDAIVAAKQNAEHLHETETTDFMLADATKLPRAKKPYALIFLDPPYFGKLIQPTLKSLYDGQWLDQESLLVIEHDAKENIDTPQTYAIVDERQYGRAVIKLLKLISS